MNVDMIFEVKICRYIASTKKLVFLFIRCGQSFIFCRTLKNHEPLDTKKMQFSCNRRRSCCGGEGHLFWTQRAVFSSHVMCQAWPDTLPLYCHCSTLEELPSLQSNPSLPSSSCKLILSTHMEMVWLLLYRERVWDHVFFMNEEEEESTHKIT